MKSFKDYAEKAIERHGLTGYNNLSRELNMNKATLSFFRAGKALPSDDTMIKLAELAGLPKEEALIDLNLWRSKDKPEVQKIWLRLSKMIGCFFAFLVFSNSQINTCLSSELSLMKQQKIYKVYILCDKLIGYFIACFKKIKPLFVMYIFQHKGG